VVVFSELSKEVENNVIHIRFFVFAKIVIFWKGEMFFSKIIWYLFFLLLLHYS